MRGAAAALVLWLAVDGARAHPDYLAWFNPLAGAHPERVLSDSNLDWGQDLFRLRDAIERRHITSLELAYFGSGDLERMTPAHVHRLAPGVPASGWIAISETRLADVYNVRRGGYRWLERYAPVERVGRSIRLYYVAPR